MSVSEDALEERFRARAAMGRGGLETVPISSVAQQTRGNIPNTPLASSFIAFLLGITFALGATLVAINGVPQSDVLTRQLGFFAASWALFHWLEFGVTAGWNREKCSVDSYLLDNGAMYHISNGIAVLEYVLTAAWNPSLKAYPYVTEIGMVWVVFGQVLRSLAMIHAATNFSHTVAFQKRSNHKLVSDGVYAWFRHPSYAGFWYWAVGTQLVLQNPFSTVFFAVVLWRFFYLRTRSEEAALIRFFGDEYVQYRARVKVWIPFIP
ncbi:prenyl cysteine carboxyl methyltransferase Ste14 [Coprinopsis cinerea okayama7|uniref:Protein-S-isoprenylcysteine O-methyltransferase n=1 Tax=Coprinopsis cinerea (strain Okayama-7 / 130 / ATCC MYA-4618 / FGSC 9003) TaxID=240176 RepID=A8NXT3_COPC7|nr:prenyl cysteine carboxyl methyltransferase Ste14 [Coprinopsis cinerea okayama7\|eukprot:XP_001837260.1 prenyl cysteine carboxyl methyltransferase Ste14 [Coprinopsis cinerea okayama7\